MRMRAHLNVDKAKKLKCVLKIMLLMNNILLKISFWIFILRNQDDCIIVKGFNFSNTENRFIFGGLN